MSEVKAKDILNLKEFAKLVGKTVPTVRNWVESHGMPTLNTDFSQGVPWRISVAEALSWLDEYEEDKKHKRALAQGGLEDTVENREIKEQMEVERLKKLTAERKAKELDLEVKQGRFILIEDVVKEVLNQFAAINDGLDALSGTAASRLAQSTSPEEIRNILTEYTDDLRNTLSSIEIITNLTDCEPKDAEALIEQETSHDSNSIPIAEDETK